MLGVSAMMGASGDAATAAAADAAQPETLESGAASGPAGAGAGGAGEVGVAAQTSAAGVSEEDNKLRMEEVDRSSGGNRWPRQETLALLKIRSDMGAAFRDSSLKGPLWEEVSRKLAELGYHRSAKKCKEKFENVLKYHKRTKEGRAMKPDSKTYRFFDQLEALENQPPPPPLLPPPRPPPQAMPVAMAIPANNPPIASQTTVPSTANPITTVATGLSPINPLPPPPQPAPAATAMAPNPISFSAIPASHGPTMAVNFGSISTSSSSSTSSDEEPERRRKRKRKWESFFQRLMNEVISKQEEMQKNFLETLERRERDRMAREEAWRVQEMARMNREHDLLVQERSMAAAKDAAVIAFLQKVSDQQTPNVAQLQAHMQAPPPPQPPPPPAVAQPQQQPQPPPPPPLPLQPQPQGPIQSTESFGNPKSESFSSSRWPKVEVQALIKIRTSLDNKYQENGPKGPLWEEISASMAKLGYNRSAKRCKEKWENINKYFKKVKESNKKRPEDSKTCPYFHQLDALYREKARNETTTASFNPAGFNVKSENPMVPIMVQPEQQWPMPQDMRPPEAGTEDQNSNNDDEDDEEEDEEEEDEAGGYEIVTNKPSSVGTGDE